MNNSEYTRRLEKLGELSTGIIDYFKANSKANKKRNVFDAGGNKLTAGYNSKKIGGPKLRNRLKSLTKKEGGNN